MSTNSTARHSLKERVQARLAHLDLRTYDLDWLDSRKVSEIETQLQWLDDTAAECRVDGHIDSAETYEEVLEVIQIESQLARAEAMSPLYGIDPHGPLVPHDYPSELWRPIEVARGDMDKHAEMLAEIEDIMSGRQS